MVHAPKNLFRAVVHIAKSPISFTANVTGIAWFVSDRIDWTIRKLPWMLKAPKYQTYMNKLEHDSFGVQL